VCLVSGACAGKTNEHLISSLSKWGLFDKNKSKLYDESIDKIFASVH